jgi:Death domain
MLSSYYGYNLFLFGLELTKDVINLASKSNYLLRRWMSLCHHLELDSEEHTIRMHLATNPQDSSMPIIHLLKAWKEQNPKQATVGNLIKNLRELKANELAGKLND